MNLKHSLPFAFGTLIRTPRENLLRNRPREPHDTEIQLQRWNASSRVFVAEKEGLLDGSQDALGESAQLWLWSHDLRRALYWYARWNSLTGCYWQASIVVNWFGDSPTVHTCPCAKSAAPAMAYVTTLSMHSILISSRRLDFRVYESPLLLRDWSSSIPPFAQAYLATYLGVFHLHSWGFGLTDCGCFCDCKFFRVPNNAIGHNHWT
jgi:hypothetical protein